MVQFDGTQRIRVTGNAASDVDPTWSPDGHRIAFSSDRSGPYSLCIVDAAGLSCLTDGLGQPIQGRVPNWSPDGQKLAFEHAGRLWTVKLDGTGLTQLTGVGGEPCCDSNPSWAPNGQKLAFETTRRGPAEVFLVNADGSGAVPFGTGRDPTWDPDGTRIGSVKDACSTGGACIQQFLVNEPGGGETISDAGFDASAPDWSTFDPSKTAYPHPRGASPFRVPLVPAYTECTQPNATHGAPLAFGSCGPPARPSSALTQGTPDANGYAPNSSGFLTLTAIPGNSLTSADEADVRVDAKLTDVRCTASTVLGCGNGPGSDYTGELIGQIDLQITLNDHQQLQPDISVGGPKTGEALFPFGMPCAATSAPDRGSECSISTTVDTLFPGNPQAIGEGHRTIWAVEDVRIYDGTDDDVGLLFAKPGVFVP